MLLENMMIWCKAQLQLAVHTAVPAAIILAAGLLAIRLVMTMVQKLLDGTKLEKAAHSLVKSAVRVVLYVLLFLIVADRLGIDVTSIIALASVLTLAVSLSVQNILTNVFGGFTLLYTDPFSAGDYVEIAGQSGTVKEIGMTYTKLLTVDNKVASIPNNSVVTAQIVNFTVHGTRRVDVAVSAAYTEDPEKVIEALLAAGHVDKILEDPAPFAAVVNYGQSAIEYTLRVWCTADDYWDVLFAVNQNVKAVFAEKGVAMTYPHLNVHLDK